MPHCMTFQKSAFFDLMQKLFFELHFWLQSVPFPLPPLAMQLSGEHTPLANHTEAPEIKAPLSAAQRATPTGEGAGWQHARARALPICPGSDSADLA